MTEVPYVAPWQTGLERFSTQIIEPSKVSATTVRAVIPAGQWWRLVFLDVRFVTSAVAGDRSVSLQINEPGKLAILAEYAPAVQPASTGVHYLFAPGVTSYANLVSPFKGQQVITIPDLLWRGLIQVDCLAENTDATDVWVGGNLHYAVENYVEHRPGVLIPQPAESPVLI